MQKIKKIKSELKKSVHVSLNSIKKIKSDLIKKSWGDAFDRGQESYEIDKKSIPFWEVVNVDGNEITMLDNAFDYGYMKGLVGTTFDAIDRETFKYMTTKKYLKEYLFDAGLEKNEINNILKNVRDSDDIAQSVFDNSYSEHWDKIRESTGFSEQEYPYFNCSGGGRMFQVGDKWNIRPDLEYLIDEYEGDGGLGSKKDYNEKQQNMNLNSKLKKLNLMIQM